MAISDPEHSAAGHYHGISQTSGSSEAAPKQAAISSKNQSKTFLTQLNHAASNLSETLAQLFENFWGVPVQISCFSVSEQLLYYWRMDDFFALQAGDAIQIRLSEAACSSLLTSVLGDRMDPQQPFRLDKLTAFEQQLMQTFNKEVLFCLSKSLVSKSALSQQNEPSTNNKQEQVHLLWLIQPKRTEDNLPQTLSFKEAIVPGKLLVSLNRSVLKPLPKTSDTPDDAAGSAVETVSEETFYEALVPVKLGIGQSHVPLADLQSLENGDLVMLENSHIEQLFLLTSRETLPDTVPIPFTITLDELSPKKRSRMEVPLTPQMEQDLNRMNTMNTSTPEQRQSSKQALWDNLMIDVEATFEPVKVPLKQLKQMSEGLVVEVGDLLHNKIYLEVEGKTVATGELVIIGDKFGVRINNVDAAENTSASPMPVALAQNPTAEAGLIATTEQAVQPPVSPEVAAATPSADAQTPETQNEDDDLFGDEDDEDW